MIEQNTHRLWMTVGAIIVGAVLIFGFKDEVGQVLGATLSKFGIEIDSSFSDKDDPEVVAGMFDYDKDSKMIVGFASDYEHKDSTLVIPEEYEGQEVVGVADQAFFDLESGSSDIPTVKSLVVENGVDYIGAYAFAMAPELTDATLPDNLVSGGTGILYGVNLDSLLVPKSMKVIKSEFTGLKLKNLVLSEGIERIEGPLNFDGELKLPSTLKYIGKTSFFGMSNTKLVIPDSVEYIGDQAFNFGATKMSNLTELVLGKNVKHIGTSAFKWAAITDLTLPDNLEYIGETAFRDAKLTTLSIPDSVKTIGDYAFEKSQLNEFSMSRNIESLGTGIFSVDRNFMDGFDYSDYAHLNKYDVQFSILKF